MYFSFKNYHSILEEVTQDVREDYTGMKRVKKDH